MHVLGKGSFYVCRQMPYGSQWLTAAIPVAHRALQTIAPANATLISPPPLRREVDGSGTQLVAGHLAICSIDATTPTEKAVSSGPSPGGSHPMKSDVDQ